LSALFAPRKQGPDDKTESESLGIDDVWLQRAILSATGDCAGEVLSRVLAEPAVRRTATLPRSDFVRALTSCSAADGNGEDFGKVLRVLSQEPGTLVWWKPALLQGLAEGLPKSGGKLGVKTLAEFTSKPPAAYQEAAAEISAFLAQVDKVMVDPSAPREQR